METISLGKIKEFAISQGYKGANYIGKWKDYLVYEPYVEYNDATFTGLPYAILIDENNNIRMSTADEAFEILDSDVMKEHYNENVNDKNNINIEKSSIPKVKKEIYDNVTMSNMNITLADIFEIARILKIENITGIKFSRSKTGYIAEVKTNNKLFFMGISSFGFVEGVREDSLTGNLIYVPNDDYVGSDELNDFKSDDNLSFSSRQEAIDAYMKRFGGFPFMSLRGLPDDVIIDKVKTALKNDEQISINFLGDEGFIRESTIDENGHEVDHVNKLEFKEFNPDIISVNLDKLKSFSILEKSLEELLQSKKKFIYDWLFYLKNNKSDDWTYDCNLYRVKVNGIVEAILRLSNDDISKNQLEYLNKISEYLTNRDLNAIIDTVDILNKFDNINQQSQEELNSDKKGYLKREDFIKSVNSEKIWSKSMTSLEVKELLDLLEKEIAKYDYESDKNFVMDGRRNGLKASIEERLSNSNENTNKKVLESLFNLWEFINNEYCVPSFDTMERLHLSGDEILKMWDEYKKTGIICFEEKNVILEMIQMINKMQNVV